jgi:hypothetical protein
MVERGYPMDNFEQRAADVPVDHPEVVEHYRTPSRSKRDAAKPRPRISVGAMVHYRVLFEELLKG